ncbi:MAG: hypothetical protein RIF42_07975 [Parvibaculaceae bacterium]|uniref:hypothetical protein n=1 Tax=Marinovum TaxID=367771 RepID=UPI00237BC91C|nr:hypothetical protein [Marinovum sp. PR37]MDD9746058.1 hypothetical protein [Marinovum sp. PR37]
MFDFTDTIIAEPSQALHDLRSFVGENADALVSAAALLGAAPAVRTVLTALDGLAVPGRPTERTMRALDDLVGLLMLKHVHEPHRIEAACFAALDPTEPVVEEICALADGLAEAVEVYCQEASETVAPGVPA